MAHFRVSHINGDGVALQDLAGRCHVARALREVPAVGTELRGVPPQRGFAILSEVDTRRTCRVIFEEIDRSPHEALARLQRQ
jgi:hypothetical protein